MNKFNLSAGKYVIADPSYFFNNGDVWENVIDGIFNDSKSTFEYNGKLLTIYAFGTMYGDGVYTDFNNFQYPVDAGMIGIISYDDAIHLLDENSIKNDKWNEFEKTFNVVEFEEKFEIFSDNGVIHFGKIIINTNDGYNDDDYSGE